MINRSNNWLRALLRLTPTRIMVLSFLFLIILCTALLMHPACYANHSTPEFIDVVFMSTSAVCITGLTTLDVATDFSRFGQCIILLFLQIGGLGMVTFTSSILVLFGAKLGLSQRRMLQEYLPGIEMASIVRVTKYVVLVFLVVELLGAILLSIAWIPIYGWGEGIFHAMFHSVASLCNAGISTIPNGLITYRSNVLVNFTVMSMVIVGGLGYVVIIEFVKLFIGKDRATMQHKLHIRVVLQTSIILTIVGTLGILLFERGNPELTSNSTGITVMTALFQSITCRSCGYSTVDISSFEPYTKQFMMALMFIGGATGSTASGIKVTTFALLIMATWAQIKGKRDIEIQGRRIPWSRVAHATSLTVIAFFTVIIVIVILNYLEPNIDYADSVFDTVSALGTVGLSTGVPARCGVLAKLLFCLCMFLGRIGPFTVALSLISQPNPQHTTLPEGNILIG